MLSGVRILIVEDEPLLAMHLADAMADEGAIVVGPFASVKDTLDALDQECVVGAVIDANLLDGDVTPVALRLLDATIPFVIYSGTGVPDGLAALYPGLSFELKPGKPVEALMAAMGSSRPA